METPGRAVIVADRLSRAFGSRIAVDRVSFEVRAGESLVVFGPNGAGKTTLLRVLGGLLRPSSGTARIGDVNLPGGAEVRRRIGIISHHSLLYDALTARENIVFAARLYGVGDCHAQAERALARMKILDRADSPVRALSRGMRQRVSIARATVHDPSVILADEPFTGLDVIGASALSTLLGQLAAGGASLVVVTHNIDEGLSLATRAAVLSRGQMVRTQDCASVDREVFGREYQQLVSADA